MTPLLIPFGKFRGQDIVSVMRKNPGYIEWMMANTSGPFQKSVLASQEWTDFKNGAFVPQQATGEWLGKDHGDRIRVTGKIISIIGAGYQQKYGARFRSKWGGVRSMGIPRFQYLIETNAGQLLQYTGSLNGFDHNGEEWKNAPIHMTASVIKHAQTEEQTPRRVTVVNRPRYVVGKDAIVKANLEAWNEMLEGDDD